MSRLSIKGLIFGAVVVYAFSMAGGFVLLATLTKANFQGGLTHDEIKAAADAVRHTTPFLLASLFISTFSTLLGGYVAAKSAKRSPLLNSGVLGVFWFVLAIVFIQSNQNPLWFIATSLILSIPVSVLGGYFVRVPKATDA